MANIINLSPTRVIQLSLSIALITIMLCCWLALRTPWLGITLSINDPTNVIRIIRAEPNGPAKTIPTPSTLKAIDQFFLVPTDKLEEPDVLNSNAGILSFFNRQQKISSILNQDTVTLTIKQKDQNEQTVTVTPQNRPLSDLPSVFWVQIFVGVVSFLISMWVWSLRQSDWGARCFALSGFGTLTFSCAAAVYSVRELAISGTLFQLLSTLNFLGAATFGCAISAMFLVYPRALVKPWVLLIAFLFFGLPSILHILQSYTIISPTLPDVYIPHLVIPLEMLTIVLFVVVQWFATRKDPRQKAVLKWLGLSIVICSGAFVSLTLLPLVMSNAPQPSQGWMFVFFLLIYIGLAMGLRRYRLFDLDAWAFKIIFYMVALLAFISIDALIIYALNFDAGFSTGLSILLIGVLYLPLRDIIWRKTVGRKNVESHIVFKHVIEVAFTNTSEERAARWHALLQSTFDPLEIKETSNTLQYAHINNDGAELSIPALSGLSSVDLYFSRSGKALFNLADLNLAKQIITLMHHAEKSRDAYERGKTEERKRIAQDLHDDIGAGLLTSLHTDDVADIKSSIRKTISEMRTVVGGLIGGSTPLPQLIASMRHETHLRLEAANITLDWPLSSCEEWDRTIDYRTSKNYISIHREIISNVIKHSGGSSVTIMVTGQENKIHIQITDNGQGVPATSTDAFHRGGNGLRNMQQRAKDMGGEVSFPAVDTGYSVQIKFSLA